MRKTFKSLSEDEWYGPQFKKLTIHERALCNVFCSRYDGKSREETENAINYFWIYREKTRNWSLVSELLSAANSKRFERIPEESSER